MVVGRSAGTYFHCLTAKVAASTRMGFPPRGEILATEPLGLIEIDKRNDSANRILLQFAGYLGATLYTSLRRPGVF